MSKRTVNDYDQLAERVGVRRCRGRDAAGFTCGSNHDTGSWTYPKLVHWADRRVSSRGVYRFLWLTAHAVEPALGVERPGWQQSYLTHQVINALARQARVRVPRRLTMEERARAKAQLVDVPVGTFLRREAMQWARREV